jgi:RNA-splicing ligase RtcB
LKQPGENTTRINKYASASSISSERARSNIVRGLGNPESFASCSQGASRVMSRSEAEKMFTVAGQIKVTEGVSRCCV